jgi:hypothetical protein
MRVLLGLFRLAIAGPVVALATILILLIRRRRWGWK